MWFCATHNWVEGVLSACFLKWWLREITQWVQRLPFKRKDQALISPAPTLQLSTEACAYSLSTGEETGSFLEVFDRPILVPGSVWDPGSEMKGETIEEDTWGCLWTLECTRSPCAPPHVSTRKHTLDSTSVPLRYTSRAFSIGGFKCDSPPPPQHFNSQE